MGSASDATDNQLQFHQAKVLEEIDIPAASWARRGQPEPTGGGGGGSVGGLAQGYESTIRPSAASASFTSEGQIALASVALDSVQGLTIANNRITFTKAGAFFINASFSVDSNGSTDAGGARSHFVVSMKKNGTTQEDMEAQAYMRYSDASRGNTRQRWELQLNGAVKAAANDYIEFMDNLIVRLH